MEYNPHHKLPDGQHATPQNSLHYPHRTKEAEERYQSRIGTLRRKGVNTQKETHEQAH